VLRAEAGGQAAASEQPGRGWPPPVVEVTRPLPGKSFKEGFVEVDGFRVRYVEAGKGPVIVSFPGSAGLELSTAKDLLAARGYRVIEVNPPGYGPDDPLPGKRDDRDMATVMLHALDRMGVKTFHVVATSGGCKHGLWVAELYPDRVLSFTAEAGECFTRPQDRLGDGRGLTARQMQANRTALTTGVFDSDPELWGHWPQYQWVPNKWWQTPAYQAKLMGRRVINNAPHGTNVHEADAKAQAHDLKVPVTALVGDRDEIMNVNVGAAWKEFIPQSHFAIVAGGTHDIQNSQPEAFVEILEACALDASPSKLRCPAD
jgi:pimeloyl-ACP methyl ester carboxylesterase